jgi:cation transport regulator ChaB
MEPISISLLGYAFYQLDPGAIHSVFAQVLPEMTKDATKRLILNGGHAILEQLSHGKLSPNHDLHRAARRAYLNATYMTVEQYKLRLEKRDKNSPSDSSNRIAWAKKLCDYLREDALATLSDSYECPDSVIDAKYEELYAQTKAPEESCAKLQEQLIAEILKEIEVWQEKNWAKEHPNFSDIPSEFKGALLNGWAYEPVPETSTQKIIDFASRRRGSKAEMSQGMQEEIKAAKEDPEKIYWFPLFSAFFSQELKTNHRAETVFSLNLLTDIKKEMGELKLSAQGIDEEKLIKLLADELTGSLEVWGKEFCERLDELKTLMEGLHSKFKEVRELSFRIFNEMLVLKDAQARAEFLQQRIVNLLDTITATQRAHTEKLKSIHSDTSETRGATATIRATTDAIYEKVVKQDESINIALTKLDQISNAPPKSENHTIDMLLEMVNQLTTQKNELEGQNKCQELKVAKLQDLLASIRKLTELS